MGGRGGLKPGQVSKRSYRYRDSQLDEGPCKSVMVKGEKSISVKCQGKGETTDFPYDVEVEASEGTVHAVLDMGLYKFCASFPPDGSADGVRRKEVQGEERGDRGVCAVASDVCRYVWYATTAPGAG